METHIIKPPLGQAEIFPRLEKNSSQGVFYFRLCWDYIYLYFYFFNLVN